MLNEKFELTDKDFEEADMDKGFVGALYKSENFRLTVSYQGSYNKDHHNKRFIRSCITFMLRPTSREMRDRYTSIGCCSGVSPYDEARLMPMDDCPKLGPINSGNYKIYDEIFTFANTVLDEILPEYFPKDAQYVNSWEY